VAPGPDRQEAAMKLLTRNEAVAALKKDHQRVKALFDRFEDSEDEREMKDIVNEAIAALKVHAAIEEELFYPAVRRQVEAGVVEDEDEILEEADEEHHAAKVLIAELELMDGSERNYCAKFMVLAENVRHHIKEEEGELFPKSNKTDIDFESLARAMETRRRELEREGVPPGPEEEMVKAAGLPDESPSLRAMKTLDVPMTGQDKPRTAARARTRKHGGRRS
jgi:hemerythrin superfamily protein